jgi:hypothetical protein
MGKRKLRNTATAGYIIALQESTAKRQWTFILRNRTFWAKFYLPRVQIYAAFACQKLLEAR